MMKDLWYKSAFGPHYTDLYSHRNAEDARQAVDFIAGQFGIGLDAGLILDLCCGAGRHSLELLSRFPVKIVGLDLAPNLLSLAKESASSAGLSLPLVRGDMRRLPFANQTFRLVLSLFTSFGYFTDEPENAGVFAEVARILTPGEGHMVFDHINPSYLKANLQPETQRRTSTGAMVREIRSIDLVGNRVEKSIHIEQDGATKRFFESVRFYEPVEIEAMAKRSGLIVEAVFGGFDASPLAASSPRALTILKKVG